MQNTSAKSKQLTIGILGGMGSYATIHAFKQYAEIFEAEKEWDRPRLVIDNRCTMPSRVRAFLHNENVKQLIDEMTDSLSNLMKVGCKKIILACNTSHLFLPMVYQNIPELEEHIVHIVAECAKSIDDSIQEIYLLASEGTIESGIYQDYLSQRGIRCLVPQREEYVMLRDCIEAVKQNKYSKLIENTFVELVNRNNACILGCTELPVLYEMYSNSVTAGYIFDPVAIALKKIREEYSNE